jgi:hypothetical protein
MSAARPLPAPPLSKRMPGGREIVPRASSTLKRRQFSAGLGRAGCRSGASSRAAPRGAPGRFDLADQGRVDQAAAALGRLEPRFDRAAQQLGGRQALARVLVEGAELALGLEAREGLVELDDELPRRLGGCRRRGHPGPRLADQQPHVRAHRIENYVVLCHVRRRWS